MRRGTTPTLIFELPFKCKEITKGHIAFSQKNFGIVLEKNIADCEADDQTLTLKLTEGDTLNLKKGQVDIQLRVQCGENKLASDIIAVSVDSILKDGFLDEITS